MFHHYSGLGKLQNINIKINGKESWIEQAVTVVNNTTDYFEIYGLNVSFQPPFGINASQKTQAGELIHGYRYFYNIIYEISVSVEFCVRISSFS
jgi:hypothetical protein